MAYKALYRSYRPQHFSEVVGQKHVIQTLKNAIKENRTSHAYVFSGLRGIGKTTIARILAKAVNCLDPINGEPCNKCANCLNIINNETTDIVELDAASNNGVDEIRNILDKVNFLPSALKKKVYIIDEVHMLSTAAFNALLKTLEEPPAYVMFILATTEPHKIPMTILSRCQRFDFKQLTIEELTLELKLICEKEHIEISEEALNAISQAAEGGMRDALSILDQANVYADSSISIDDVNSITGSISNNKLIELITALNEDNATKAIDIVNELLNMGKEVSRLTTCVIQFCRDILLYKSVNNVSSEKYIYSTKEFKDLASNTINSRLFYYIDVLVDVQNKIRFTNSQRIYLEVGIMKIVNSASLDIDVLGRLQELEERVNNGGTPSESYASNLNVEQRLTIVENKVKKINNELEKAALNDFEEKVNSKINLLEDTTSKISVLPQSIESRMQVLENILINSGDDTIVKNSNDITTTNSSDYANLEKQIKDLNDKNNELLNAMAGDIESLKSQVSEIDPSSTDDVILELMDKVTMLEEKVDTPFSNTPISIPSMNAFSQEDFASLKEKLENANVFELSSIINNLNIELDNLKNNNGSSNSEALNNLTNEVNVLKEEIEVLKNSNGLENVKFDDSKINELIISYNNIKEDLEKIKIEQPKELDSSMYTSIITLQQSLNNLEQKYVELSNSDLNNDLTKITTDLTNSINEIKANYFVLTKALKLLTDKMDATETIDVTEFEDKVKALEERINNIDVTIKAIKENEINKEQIKELNKQVVKEEKTVEIKEKLKEEIKQPEVKEESAKIELTKRNSPFVFNQIDDDELDLTNKIYDVKILERILHEARTKECREAKPLLANKWPLLENKVGGLLSHIARVLASGLLVANGLTHLLIVYPNAQLCNHVMNPKNHQDAMELIKVTFGKSYDFLALPEDTWREKRAEYRGLFGIGNTYPKLSPINNPQLRIVEGTKEPALTEREKIMKKADDFFGPNN